MALNNPIACLNRQIIRISIVLIPIAANCQQVLAADCPLVLATTNQGDIFVPPFTLHMLPPTPPDPHPTSWDSAVPMSITGIASKPCTVSPEVGIVTTPITLAGSHYLYVPTYSGEESKLFVIDATSCQIVWRSPIVDAGGITATADGYRLPGKQNVKIAQNCLPEKP